MALIHLPQVVKNLILIMTNYVLGGRKIQQGSSIIKEAYTCENNLCKENAEYQQCIKEEKKQKEEEVKRREKEETKQLITWICIVVGMIIAITLCVCCYFKWFKENCYQIDPCA